MRTKKFRVEIKPAKGYEDIVSDYTYSQFIRLIETAANTLGLNYKIKEGLRNMVMSGDWTKKGAK